MTGYFSLRALFFFCHCERVARGNPLKSLVFFWMATASLTFRSRHDGLFFIVSAIFFRHCERVARGNLWMATASLAFRPCYGGLINFLSPTEAGYIPPSSVGFLAPVTSGKLLHLPSKVCFAIHANAIASKLSLDIPRSSVSNT
jgi:hypothetical protein